MILEGRFQATGEQPRDLIRICRGSEELRDGVAALLDALEVHLSR